MSGRKLIAILAACAAAVSGCGTLALPDINTAPPPVVRSTNPPAPPGGYDKNRPYPLLPHDRVTIEVLEDPTLNATLPIPPDGVLEVWKSEAGPGQPRRTIVAKGKTTVELAEAVAEVYKEVKFQSRPYVVVTLQEAVPREVNLKGAVNSGNGKVALPKNLRLTLTQAINASGGAAPDADLSAVRINRIDPATELEVSLPTFNLLEMERTAAFDRDPTLEPGDVIIIPRLGHVTIWGNINSAGRYLCRHDMTLMQLFAEAGGPKPFSKLSEVRIVRDEGTANEGHYVVDVDALLSGERDDPRLAAGDRIWIDEDWK